MTKNLRLEHQLVLVSIEKVGHAIAKVESTRAVTHAKDELANAKETLPVLERRVSRDREVMHSAIEDSDRVQGEWATTSAKL